MSTYLYLRKVKEQQNVADLFGTVGRNDLKTFKENKIFYASNLCGTEFKQAIDFEIRK